MDVDGVGRGGNLVVGDLVRFDVGGNVDGHSTNGLMMMKRR